MLTQLDDNQIPQSNTVLFNDYCESYTALLEKATYCWAVKFESNDYDNIPAKAICQAAYKALGIEEAKQENVKEFWPLLRR